MTAIATVSPARVAANQANAAKSTGPRTPEGKERSRANALKHGLTGAGVVLPEEDAVEVERLSVALRHELKAEGETGRALARRMATLAVRMDRCVVHETAALSERVRTVMGEFEAPEGVDEATAAKLRIEAGNIALFDPSKEATLARRYEAAAERGFFRALQELRQLKKDSTNDADPEAAREAVAAQNRASLARMGSFLPAKTATVPTLSRPSQPAPIPVATAAMPREMASASAFDVPFTIGRAR